MAIRGRKFGEYNIAGENNEEKQTRRDREKMDIKIMISADERLMGAIERIASVLGAVGVAGAIGAEKIASEAKPVKATPKAKAAPAPTVVKANDTTVITLDDMRTRLGAFSSIDSSNKELIRAAMKNLGNAEKLNEFPSALYGALLEELGA